MISIHLSLADDILYVHSAKIKSGNAERPDHVDQCYSWDILITNYCDPFENDRHCKLN